MNRTIKASEVKPGMTIRWEQEDLVLEFPVARNVQFRGRHLLRTPMRKVGTISPDTEVTVLSEPAPAKPEEPTELGVKARVREGRFLRLREGLEGSNVWFEEGTGYRWTWDDLCEMGPVTVIPDQGWTVPADGEPATQGD